MSELNKDKEVLQKGRKNVPEKEEVREKLRDRVASKLMKKLEDMNISQTVSSLWSITDGDRAEWLKRQEVYLHDWDNFVEADAENPLGSSSNLHLPMPFIVAKTYHARMFQAIIESPPGVKARREDSGQKAELVQDLMRYTLEEWINHREGIDEVMDRWIWSWVTTGVGILKCRWDKQFTRYLDVKTEIVPGSPEFITDELGNQVIQPKFIEKETDVMVDKLVYDGPMLEHVQPEDLAIIGGDGEINRADTIIHRQFLTSSDLWLLADREVFDEDAVRKVIESGPDSKSGQLGGNLKTIRAEKAGQGSVDTEADLDRYEVLEAYMRKDVDGSGINSDIVVWVHQRTGELLRATYLRRINKAGERPFFKIDFHKRPGETYGMGLVEVMHPLTKEMDAIHNMRLDWGLLSNMPFGFYRPTSNIEPEKMELKPGMLIPVDNPQTDVFFPNLGNRSTFGFNEEAALQNMIERLTGISEVSLGVQSGTQGAARTATGVRALVGESNANLDIHLKRLSRGYKKALEYLLHMLQQRIPAGLSFRVTGMDGNNYWKNIKNQDDIEGDYDFDISPNSANTNPTLRQEIAGQVLQLTSNPLDIQLGVVNPGNRFEALKSFYKSVGIKDFNRFVNAPPQHRVLYNPEEEANRILRGEDVPVTPEMDHEGFIAYWEFIQSEDEILGQFDTDAAIRMAAQAKKHSDMMQALQEMAAQQRNAQQMQQNAQQGAQVSQAPTGNGQGEPTGNQ